MSAAAMHWFETLSLPEKYAGTLCALAYFHNKDNGCFPTIARIARFAKCSPATVKRRLQVLREMGLISKATVCREGLRRTAYTLHLARACHAPTDLKALRVWLRDRKPKVPGDRSEVGAGATKKEQVAFHVARLTLNMDRTK